MLRDAVNKINEPLNDEILAKIKYVIDDIKNNLNTMRDIPIPFRTLDERFINKKAKEYTKRILNSL